MVVRSWTRRRDVLFLESRETLSKSIKIDFYWLVAVNSWVFWEGVWLVKVVSVVNKSTPDIIKYNRSIWSKKHCYCSYTSSGSGITFGIDCDIRTNNDGVPTIPALALDPVEAIEECIGTAVASVNGSDTLNIVIATFSE